MPRVLRHPRRAAVDPVEVVGPRFRVDEQHCSQLKEVEEDPQDFPIALILEETAQLIYNEVCHVFLHAFGSVTVGTVLSAEIAKFSTIFEVEVTDHVCPIFAEFVTL